MGVHAFDQTRFNMSKIDWNSNLSISGRLDNNSKLKNGIQHAHTNHNGQVVRIRMAMESEVTTNSDTNAGPCNICTFRTSKQLI
jgi:hypothetical protein